MMTVVQRALVMIEFSTDDDCFRLRLYGAIRDRACPDFAVMTGGSGRYVCALWRPEDAESVRVWAVGIGASIAGIDGAGDAVRA